MFCAVCADWCCTRARWRSSEIFQSHPLLTLQCELALSCCEHLNTKALADSQIACIVANSDDIDRGATKQLKIKISFQNDEELSVIAKDAKNCSGIRELLERYTVGASHVADGVVASASADGGW